jgi:hypothetical protein
MTQYFPRQTVYGSVFTATGTGDALSFKPARPVIVTDWGVIVTTALSGSNGKATCNLRPTAGSTSGQTVGSTASSTGPIGQTITTDTAGGQITLAPLGAGNVYLHRVRPAPGISASGNGFTGQTASQGLQVNPGQEVAVNVGTGVGTAGAVVAFITYYELPETGDASAPGSVNALANVTVAQS